MPRPRALPPTDVAAPHQSLLDRRTPVADLPEFLSPEEFRAYLGLSKTLVYELLRRGDISHCRFGRCIRIPKSALSKVK